MFVEFNQAPQNQRDNYAEFNGIFWALCYILRWVFKRNHKSSNIKFHTVFGRFFSSYKNNGFKI